MLSSPAHSPTFAIRTFDGLMGDLSLHGVTKSQPVVARVLLHGDTLRASGELTIQQPDFQLKPVTVAGSMMKVSRKKSN